MTMGRLEKVDLRKAWLSESGDFTPWLAKPENLSLLGETIDIELELESQEKEVGPFRADLLCKDTATDDWVLIENQLERTDHCHLGQLLTYAAGLNAVTIVWIAQRFTEEHRAALDWLNERTDEKINLFGLELELWKIGDSPIAPKFNVVCQPNEWSRRVQTAAAGTLTELNQLHLKFWTAFKQDMEEKGSFVRCQQPRPTHSGDHPIGFTGAHLKSVISSWNSELNVNTPEIRAELCLTGPQAKQKYGALELRKDEIERNLGTGLVWHNSEANAVCRLYFRFDSDFRNEDLWPQQFEWLRQRLESMHKYFGPLIKNLKVAPAA